MLRVDALISSPIYLLGLVQVLTSEGITVVAARTSATEQLSWLADAALLDVDALTSADALDYIAETARTTAVLVLLSDGSLPAEQYLRAGATGAISRRESSENLVEALRAVTAGAQVLPEGHAVPPAPEHPDPPVLNLSEREEQVLNQISRGLTHGQIATRLGISPHTVDTYVKRIRAKLGVGNKAELTRIALLARLTKSVTEQAA
jgi:DNA-binding NarL/FixJ family response regulator